MIGATAFIARIRLKNFASAVRARIFSSTGEVHLSPLKGAMFGLLLTGLFLLGLPSTLAANESLDQLRDLCFKRDLSPDEVVLEPKELGWVQKDNLLTERFAKIDAINVAVGIIEHPALLESTTQEIREAADKKAERTKKTTQKFVARYFEKNDRRPGDILSLFVSGASEDSVLVIRSLGKTLWCKYYPVGESGFSDTFNSLPKSLPGRISATRYLFEKDAREGITVSEISMQKIDKGGFQKFSSLPISFEYAIVIRRVSSATRSKP
jgi:hypothetical protein